MNTPIETYLEKISSVLSENVMADLKTDQVKLQLGYIIDLLAQLKKVADYRIEYYEQEWRWSTEICRIIAPMLAPLHIDVFADDTNGENDDALSLGDIREKAVAMKKASSRALDLFYQEKARIESFNRIEKEIHDVLRQWSMRDIMLRTRHDK